MRVSFYLSFAVKRRSRLRLIFSVRIVLYPFLYNGVRVHSHIFRCEGESSPRDPETPSKAAPGCRNQFHDGADGQQKWRQRRPAGRVRRSQQQQLAAGRRKTNCHNRSSSTQDDNHTDGHLRLSVRHIDERRGRNHSRSPGGKGHPQGTFDPTFPPLLSLTLHPPPPEYVTLTHRHSHRFPSCSLHIQIIYHHIGRKNSQKQLPRSTAIHFIDTYQILRLHSNHYTDSNLLPFSTQFPSQ